MKKVIFLLAVSFTIVSCSNQVAKDNSDSKCTEIPADIPKVIGKNQPVIWNCELQRAYERGEVTVVRDSVGEVVCITYTNNENDSPPPENAVQFNE